MSHFSLFDILKNTQWRKKCCFFFIERNELKKNKTKVKQKEWSLQSFVVTPLPSELQNSQFKIVFKWYWLSPHDLLGFCSCSYSFLCLFFFLFSSYLPPLASVTRCWSVVSVRWHHPTWTPHSVDLQAAGCWWGLGSRLHGRHLHWADPTGWSIAAPHPIAGRRRWPFLRRRCSIGQWSGTAQPLPFDSDWFLGWPAS